MDNQPMDMAKELNNQTLPKPAKRIRRWSLMFVGDHGEIVSVGRFKLMAISLVFVMIIVVASAVCLYFFSKSNIKENRKLKNTLASTQQKVEDLQSEKDVLMVRLVMAESKLKQKQSNNQKQTAKSLNAPIASVKRKTDIKTSIAETPAKPVKTKKLQAVDVKDVTVRHELLEIGGSSLRIKFTLNKVEQSPETVSGRAFVVLKHDEDDKDQWLVLPSVPLISGKPSRIKRGKYFSIARFKSMHFEKNYLDVPKLFKNMTVFIYNNTGALMLKKEFPIEIKEVVSMR
jgi:hypothetical protein